MSSLHARVAVSSEPLKGRSSDAILPLLGTRPGVFSLQVLAPPPQELDT